jgi:RNA polymerase sigma factor (sigma-70 family)
MSVVKEWDVSTEEGFLACYHATFREIYGYAGLLSGHDRDRAEDLVHDVYLGALSRVQRGEASTVTFGYLRTAVRHRWIDRWRSEERELRRQQQTAGTEARHDVADDGATALLADLSTRERTIMIMRYVDDMPVSRVAEQLGVTEGAVESVLARAMRRLRGGEAHHA